MPGVKQSLAAGGMLGKLGKGGNLKIPKVPTKLSDLPTPKGMAKATMSGAFAVGKGAGALQSRFRRAGSGEGGAKGLWLPEIRAVVRGATTDSFMKSKRWKKAEKEREEAGKDEVDWDRRCFSIMGSSRTFDFECYTRAQRNMLCEAVEELMEVEKEVYITSPAVMVAKDD